MRHKNKELMNRIVEFVDFEFANFSRVPSQQEIANKFNVTKQCISKYIKEMAELGMVKTSGGSRGIMTKTMMKTQNSVLNIPVVGSIACGSPLLAEENIESYLPIPKKFLGSGNYFILKAKGDSMINAGISDGDYVIVKQQEVAEEGQIVVALIDDEATLKRFYVDKQRKQIRLHPENDNMQDMLYDNVVIQGVAIKIIKDLF